MKKQSLMPYARGDKTVDLLLKNASLINVFTGEIETINLAVHDGIFVGFGDYSAKQVIDLNGDYVAPGFIDGHVHIESSMMTPPQFAEVVVPKGTTTVIADPHEIANVSGVKGIEYMIKASQDIPLNVFFMIPSCVPATAFENAGATITTKDIKRLIKHSNVLGLGEVMDYPAVISGEKNIHEKLNAMQRYPIDGHAPDILGHDLNAYIAAGVETDHECTKVESMLERLKRGMYVHLREGSATRNVKTLLKGVTKENYRRLLFCTDDKHPEDIEKEGHINFNVNLAIAEGVDPVQAIRMATINAAECYRLKKLGAIGIGYRADFIVFETLEDIQPRLVYKDGKCVAKNQVTTFKSKQVKDKYVIDTVHIDREKIDFRLPLKSDKVNVIGLVKNNITTEKKVLNVTVENGYYKQTSDDNLMKLAVIERHKKTGNYGLGLVEGYGLKNGAIAMTIAHDSHNIIIIGDNDRSMEVALDAVVKYQGGIVLVEHDQVVEALQLEIAGIMTTSDVKTVSSKLLSMTQKANQMGLNDAIDDPFISLAFLSLPVIPALKLTDCGLFDVETFKHIPIEAEAS